LLVRQSLKGVAPIVSKLEKLKPRAAVRGDLAGLRRIGSQRAVVRLRGFRAELQGSRRPRRKHIKHGANVSDAECLRSHFEWIPDEKRIGVGHAVGTSASDLADQVREPEGLLVERDGLK